MTLVTAHMSISLDGCYAGPEFDGKGNWMESPEALAFFRITRWVTDTIAWRESQGFEGGERDTNSEVIEEMIGSAGAHVMGRRMFNGGEGPWGDEPPFHAPVFVVTHHPRETLVKQGGTSFTFVTEGVEKAVEQARAAAGGKNVAIAGGGSLLQQVIKAGLLDQLDLHIAPAVVGEGMRLFDPEALGLVGGEAVELTPTKVVAIPTVTHIRYQVEGRTPMVFDDRGQGDTPEAG
jgi:dihydrofolate reductase